VENPTNLHPKRLDVAGPVGTTGEIGKIELDLGQCYNSDQFWQKFGRTALAQI
jgi:hypothetical protein